MKRKSILNAQLNRDDSEGGERQKDFGPGQAANVMEDRKSLIGCAKDGKRLS